MLEGKHSFFTWVTMKSAERLGTPGAKTFIIRRLKKGNILELRPIGHFTQFVETVEIQLNEKPIPDSKSI